MTEANGMGAVVAVGEILWDLLPAGPRLGGAMANFAIGCARLGRPSSLVSAIGADSWGDRALRALAEQQRGGAALLDTSLLETVQDEPTGRVEVTMGPHGQPAYAIASPAAWDFIAATPAALLAAQEAGAVCFGTLSQRAEPSRTAIRQIVEAGADDMVRVLDVNVRAPFFGVEVARWSMAHATVAKVSEEELNTLAEAIGVEGLPHTAAAPEVHALEACGRRLLQAHPHLQLLAVTLGARGSLLLTPADANHHPGHRIQVVDTVGAGDAFTAGLVHAWLRGAKLAQVNVIGNLCGSFVASQPGATPVFPSELLEKVEAALAPADRKDADSLRE